jgi:hypothetical protein
MKKQRDISMGRRTNDERDRHFLGERTNREETREFFRYAASAALAAPAVLLVVHWGAIFNDHD